MSGARGSATAAAIENAALDLALERGWGEVTVDMICERVGVSQRTFFNHFPTKDDAFLGRSQPSVDEHAARRFLVSDGPLLIEAISLVRVPEDDLARLRMPERVIVLSANPALLRRQMGRMEAIRGELAGVIALRLERSHPNMPEADRLRVADMITHLIGGVFQWISFHLGAADCQTPLTEVTDQARATLAAVLEASKPRRGSGVADDGRP